MLQKRRRLRRLSVYVHGGVSQSISHRRSTQPPPLPTRHSPTWSTVTMSWTHVHRAGWTNHENPHSKSPVQGGDCFTIQHQRYSPLYNHDISVNILQNRRPSLWVQGVEAELSLRRPTLRWTARGCPGDSAAPGSRWARVARRWSGRGWCATRWSWAVRRALLCPSAAQTNWASVVPPAGGQGGGVRSSRQGSSGWVWIQPLFCHKHSKGKS